MPLSIKDVLEMDARALDLRHGLGCDKARPPRFDALVDFIRGHFGDAYDVQVQDWGETPFRKVGRLISHTGKRREGKRLLVRVREADGRIGRAVLDHRTCATYGTNWDIVRWIAREHAKPSVEAECDVGSGPAP